MVAYIAAAEVRVPTVHRFAACKVQIYADDHFPPHFHLVGAGWRCSVEIATLKIIAGKAPRGDFEAAIAWARQPATACGEMERVE